MFDKVKNQAREGIQAIFDRLTKEGSKLGHELGHRAENAFNEVKKEAQKNAPVIETRQKQKQNSTRTRLSSFLLSSLVWMGLSRIPWRQLGIGAMLLIRSLFSKREEEAQNQQMATPRSRTDYIENAPDRSPITTDFGMK